MKREGKLKDGKEFKKSYLFFSRLIILINTTILFFIFVCFTYSDTFRFEATIKSTSGVVPAVIINIYENGKKIDEKMTNSQGNFALNLAHNHQYILELVKKSFIIEKVVIDTKVSDKLLKDGGIELAIDNVIPIYEAYEGIKAEIFEQPILYYIYNEKTNYFEIDRKRSKSLTAIEGQVNSAKRKQATNDVKEANDLFNKKQYLDALVVYRQVLTLMPDNQQVKTRIKQIEGILKDDKEIQNKYEEIISQANKKYKENEIYDALVLFKKAKDLKPDESYSSYYINLIDSIISRQYSQNKVKFDEFKKNADKLYKDKKYEEALNNYLNARKLIPDDIYVNKQITQIEKIIDNEKKQKEKEEKLNDEKFDNYIKQAKVLMKNEDYVKAIDIIKKALEIKPNENSAIQLLSDCENLQSEKLKEELIKKKEKNYSDTINLADNALKNKKYEIAHDLYIAALRIKPNEKYPTKQIKKIETILKNQQNKDQERIQKDEIEKENTSEKFGSTDSKINSFKKEIEKCKKEGNYKKQSLLYTNIADIYFDKGELGQALKYLDDALNVSTKSGDINQTTNIYRQKGMVLYDSGLYSQSIKHYEKAIELNKKMGKEKESLHLLNELGNNLFNVYQYDNALEVFQQSITIAEKFNDPIIIDILDHMADIYFSKGNLRQAIQYYKKAIQAAEKYNRKDLISSLKNNLGVVYYKLGYYDDAIKLYDESINLSDKDGNKKILSQSYNNKGNVNYTWNKFDEAIQYYEKSLQIKREIDFQEGIAVSLYNIGNAYIELRNLIKASEYLNEGLDVAKKMQFVDVIQQTYLALSKVYELNNDLRKAVDAYKKYSDNPAVSSSFETPINESTSFYGRGSFALRTLKKELYRQKILAENEALLNKQKQQQLSIKELQIKTQSEKLSKFRTAFLLSILSLLLASILIVQLFKRYNEKKVMSELISFQNKQITDSIEYASRIQKALLPPEQLIKSFFPEMFILNLPKDLVSGDYFYVTEIEGRIYLAVADCTGHGVPGAFMSMLGLTLIEEVIMLSTFRK